MRSESAGFGRALATMWAPCAVAVAATLVNPYGLGLWSFLSETVGLSRRFIPEWGMATGSLTTLGVWAIFALIMVVAIRRADRATRLPAIAVSVFWCLAAFKVSRLDAFFALSTIGLLTPELIQVLHARRRNDAPQPSSLVRHVVVGAVALVTLVATVPLLKTNLLCIDVHAAATFPEAEAMAFVRDRQLRGRMVTFFDWGQYAIWHKPAALRVSMDGRRENGVLGPERGPAPRHVPGARRRAVVSGFAESRLRLGAEGAAAGRHADEIAGLDAGVSRWPIHHLRAQRPPPCRNAGAGRR